MKFYCALCRSPREMNYRKNLTNKNYLQIIVTSVFLTWLFFPVFGFKCFWIFFFVWGAFELTNKILYRRELPCPHCAFDPTWYRKDVKVARQKVLEFFENNPIEAQKRMDEIDAVEAAQAPTRSAPPEATF
jgi:hypothetical protein